MNPPIWIVDVDDSLLSTDLLLEHLLQILVCRPLAIFSMILHALQGTLSLKIWAARQMSVDLSTLPVRTSVMERLQAAKKEGAKLYLASASPQAWVDGIAGRLKIFDGALGSSSVNLHGLKKLEAIQKKFGMDEFAYVGDSHRDIPLWKASRKAVAVNPGRRAERFLATHSDVEILRDEDPVLKLILKQLRIHQWVKNILLFLPIISAHLYFDGVRWATTILGFLAFSFLASFVYILNDILDLESDRKHPTKKNRPLASGKLSLKVGAGMLPVLLFLSALFSLSLPGSFQGALLLYLLLNLGYSLKLKRVVGLDVVLLAGLYTLRIVAGGAAADVPISQWLLAFSIFFFFGLAMVKRLTEVSRTEAKTVAGRGYRPEDRFAVFALGSVSSLISVLVLVLYFSSDVVGRLYSHPERLWLLTPLFLYWQTHTWLMAYRDEIHDDPVVYALKEKESWCVAAGVALVLFISNL